MVGLGGGFILVPLLRLAFGLAPAEAAGTSLILVVANSTSGAITYWLQERVDVRLGLLLAAGGLPGSIVGAIAVTHLSSSAFDLILGIVLVGVALDMIVNRQRRTSNRVEEHRVNEVKAMSYRLALALGFVVGLASSIFGIGGGVIVVPTLLYVSTLPAHAISATSHFAIFLTSPIGLGVHALQHDVRFADIVPLALGGLLGGPLGARLSLRLQSPQLLMLVACALIVTACALVVRHLI